MVLYTCFLNDTRRVADCCHVDTPGIRLDWTLLAGISCCDTVLAITLRGVHSYDSRSKPRSLCFVVFFNMVFL